MIDFSQLLNYGVLGLWTVNLLYDKYTSKKSESKERKEMTGAINNLTIAVSQCPLKTR